MLLVSQGTPTILTQTIKRSMSSEIQTDVKKIMVRHETSKQQSKCFAAAPPPMKFVSAVTVAISMYTNNNAIPEISDEELLKMALMFEKEQQK